MYPIDSAKIFGILNEVKKRSSEELESETLEFKAYRDERALHNAKELAEEMSAFSNFKGGTVIIGVRDSSKISYGQWPDQLAGIEGVDVTTTKERIRGRLQPEINFDISAISFEGRSYLVISINHRPDTLVSTKSGKICIRDGKSSRPMTPYEIQQAVKGLTTYDWSDEVLPDLNLQEVLDVEALGEAISDFVQRRDLHISPNAAAYLESIGATTQGYLTQGGLIFLGTSDMIRKYLGDFEYRFSWKRANGELIVNDVWDGSIWRAIKRAKKHFNSSNSEGTFHVRGQEFAVPLMDPVAFHEAYLNAVVHRDYSAEGMISVNFTGDQLNITSPGLFYGGVTPENIARHEPRHRNKALARILMNHRLVDRAGMGVLRMGMRSLMYGRPFPEFKEDSESVEVTLDASYLRASITVLSNDHLNDWGIPELLILNSVYEVGFVPVVKVEKRLSRVSENAWVTLLDVINRVDQVELCGTKQGIFLRVTPQWRNFMKVGKGLRVPTTSEKHVSLYRYLKKHIEASNADLTELLNYRYTSQTSKFLREAGYVKRKGSGPTARWFLNVNGPTI